MEERWLFQTRDGGSIPASPLHFSRCSLSSVSTFVKQHHYSHTHPGGVDFAFRLDWNGGLAGACLFGWMAGNPRAVLIKGYAPKDFRELMRLVLLDAAPRNSETQFVGWCLRYLRKNTKIVACVSFADPAHGHTGTIYRAGNWHYCGLQKPDRPRIIVDGIEVHPRMAYDRFGTSSASAIRAMGHVVELRPREPKHKFIYYLRQRSAALEREA